MHSAATQLSNNFSVELIAGLETAPTASVSERNLQLEHFCKLSKYDERLFQGLNSKLCPFQSIHFVRALHG